METEDRLSGMDGFWTDTLCAIQGEGSAVVSRNGGSYEMIGFSEKLPNVNKNFLFNSFRKLDPHYACAELLWYLMMTDDTSFLQLFAPGYKRFTEDGVHAFGAYGHRWMRNSTTQTGQLIDVIETLKIHPETRQAIMTMWHGTDLISAKLLNRKDLPCTLTHQFLLRKGYLHLITTMRSNDAWLGLPYDVFCNTQLLKIVADYVGAVPGSYTHQAGSMHLYDKNADAVEEFLAADSNSTVVDTPEDSQFNRLTHLDLSKQVSAAIGYVWRCKQFDWNDDDPLYFTRGTLIADAAFVCAAKFAPEAAEYIHSPMLRMAVEEFQNGKE